MKLWIDVETLPTSDPRLMLPFLAKPDPMEAWHKTGLYPHTGRLLCIGVAVGDAEPEVLGYDDEEMAVRDLEQLVLKHRADFDSYRWVAGWRVAFDVQFIRSRAALYGRGALLEAMPWHHRGMLDIRDVWSCGRPDAKGSLAEVAEFFGVPGKGSLDGSKVAEAYFAGRHEEIKRYCPGDVRMVRSVAARLGISP